MGRRQCPCSKLGIEHSFGTAIRHGQRLTSGSQNVLAVGRVHRPITAALQRHVSAGSEAAHIICPGVDLRPCGLLRGSFYKRHRAFAVERADAPWDPAPWPVRSTKLGSDKRSSGGCRSRSPLIRSPLDGALSGRHDSSSGETDGRGVILQSAKTACRDPGCGRGGLLQAHGSRRGRDAAAR